MLKKLIISLLTLPALASANGLDSGLSPLESHINGSKITGAYNTHDILHCSQSAKNKYIPQALPDNYILKMISPLQSLSVGTSLKEINRIINQTLNTLNQQNDPTIENKYVCTGFYIETETPGGNALSLGHGYLIFDYTLIHNLYSLPDDKRSYWAFDFLVLHEFAHQLQYWVNDPEVIKSFKGEQTSKIPELAADCVAGALLRLTYIGYDNELFQASFRGVTGSSEFLGDYNTQSQHHHGTPSERMSAVQYGAQMMSNQRVSIMAKLTKVSSQGLINSCNQYVKTNLN